MSVKAKRILCLLIAVLLCGSLVGCKELDDARAHHAIMQEDGTVLLNGKTYVPLPYHEDFNPLMDWVDLVAVTEPDVPVLLKDMFASLHFYSSDTSVLKDSHILGYNDTYYCLEEDAAELIARMEAGVQLSSIRYLYSHWDPEEEIWSEKVMRLTEEQVNAVKRVKATVSPFPVGEPEGVCAVSLEWCSEDGLFSRVCSELYEREDGYALVDWQENGDILLYKVPAEYKAIFDSILAPAAESSAAFDKFMGW